MSSPAVWHMKMSQSLSNIPKSLHLIYPKTFTPPPPPPPPQNIPPPPPPHTHRKQVMTKKGKSSHKTGNSGNFSKFIQNKVFLIKFRNFHYFQGSAYKFYCLFAVVYLRCTSSLDLSFQCFQHYYYQFLSIDFFKFDFID